MGTRKSVSRSAKSRRTSAEFMEKLKHFIRSSGPDYLRDNNISSVGIGYKRKEGKPTDQLSIQFTVAKKAAPEALELLGSSEIPRSFLIDGVEVPTDVIQRRYEPAFKIVASASDTRKTRIDPIVPGVSVANNAETAGTLGCIVFDRQDETPYILSNWHVLHAPEGEIGDEIVQPARMTTTAFISIGSVSSSALISAWPGIAPSPASRIAPSSRIFSISGFRSSSSVSQS